MTWYTMKVLFLIKPINFDAAREDAGSSKEQQKETNKWGSCQYTNMSLPKNKLTSKQLGRQHGWCHVAYRV
jgi:hypothetical protein